MVRLFLFLFGLVPAAMAQFAGMGATGDGATLYFSTPLRFRGTTSSFYPKVLRLDSQLTEFLSVDPGGSVGWTTTNFFNLVAAQPSSDGSKIAIDASRPCNGGSGCLAVQTLQGVVVDRTGKQLFSDVGYVSLSSNGRWALFYARNTFGNPIPASKLVDLTDNTVTPVPYTFGAHPRRQVANDGTVAVVSGTTLKLWRADGERTLTGASLAPSTYAVEPQVLLSADAAKVVHQTPTGLALYNVAQQTETVLTNTPVRWTAMSDDASVIAFINSADSQVWLANPLRQLTRESEGITEVTLSGDGRIAFASTDGGRLLSINVASGAVTELIPRTPWITNSISPVAPGSLYALTGHNLAPAQVRIADVDMPVQAATPDAVWFQVPWELPLQAAAPVQFFSGNSPLETSPGPVDVTTLSASAFGDNSVLLAVHQDFSGLITDSSPAAAGEAVVFYATGLGPVQPPVATGAPGPSSPLAAVTTPMHCDAWDGSPNEMTVLFAGLAPGMVGIYQVSVIIPAGLRLSPISINCEIGVQQPSYMFGLIPVKL